MNINDVKKIAFLGSGAMNHEITRVCIQTSVDITVRNTWQEFIDNDVAKIKESFDFLKLEIEIVKDSFKMIGR